MKLKLLSIIIPVFNEGETIHRLLEKLKDVQLVDGIQKELIIVNDCSTDHTDSSIRKFIDENPGLAIKYHSHEKNQGKGAALHTGIAKATGDYLIIQDADLEYNPEEFNDLLRPVIEYDADVVYGSRFVGGRAHRVMFFWHSIGNKMLTFLSNMFSNLNITDMETCYKLFKTSIVQSLHLEEKRFGFEPEVTTKIAQIPGIRIFEVGISYRGRTYEEGKKINWKDGVRATYSILKYGFFQTSRWSNTLIYTLLLLFMGRSLYQYVSGPSLWLDESFLALSLISRNFFELLKPLDYGQMAPILFIELEKLFTILIPNSDYGLRLLSLLFYWGILYFSLRTIRLLTKNPITVIFTFCFIGFNFTLFAYSNELKQYIADVLVVIAVIYFYLKLYTEEKKKIRTLMIVGIISVFLSSIAPFILFAVGLVLVPELWKNKILAKNYFILLASWGMVIFLNYFLFYYNHPAVSGMKTFWVGAEAFLPLYPFDQFVHFIATNFEMMFSSSFIWHPNEIHLMTVLVYLGIGFLLLKNFRMAIILALPMTLHLLASAFEFYPAIGRLILYFIPLLGLLSVFGMDAMFSGWDWIKKKMPPRLNSFLSVNPAFVGILIPFYIYVNSPFNLSFQLPLKNQEMKDCLQFIEKNHKSGDKIYIYSAAQYAFKYYSQTKYAASDLPYVISQGSENTPGSNVNEMRKLENRNWLLFSHISPERNQYYIHAMDSLGFKKIDSLVAVGASTYLFDFGKQEESRLDSLTVQQQK